MKYTIGIDEVGRGPIAGPVAVSSFVFLNDKIAEDFKGVKESKQLTEKKREFWFEKIEIMKSEKLLDFFVSFRSEKIIDSLGISKAISMALGESLEKLYINPDKSIILLDGGLKAPGTYKEQKTIIKGDEKEIVIALASICAKVTRDRYMDHISLKYPEYGFERHKGYGTRDHYDALCKFGLTELHRKSFLSRFLNKDKFLAKK